MLVMSRTGTLQGEFCESCLTHYFWKYTLINLVFGWWGFLSFFITIVILLNNLAQFLKPYPVTDISTTVPASTMSVGNYCPYCHSSLSIAADFSRVPWLSLINSSLILMFAGILTLVFMINQTASPQEWLIVLVLYGVFLFRVGNLVQSGHFSRKVCKQCGQSQSVVA